MASKSSSSSTDTEVSNESNSSKFDTSTESSVPSSVESFSKPVPEKRYHSDPDSSPPTQPKRLKPAQRSSSSSDTPESAISSKDNTVSEGSQTNDANSPEALESPLMNLSDSPEEPQYVCSEETEKSSPDEQSPDPQELIDMINNELLNDDDPIVVDIEPLPSDDENENIDQDHSSSSSSSDEGEAESVSSTGEDSDGSPPVSPVPVNNIFEGSKHTVQDAAVALAQIADKHNVSQSCLDDITKYVSEILPDDNNFPKTLYKYQSEVKFLTEGYHHIKNLTGESSLFLFDIELQLQAVLEDNWDAVMRRREEFLAALENDVLAAGMGSLFSDHFSANHDKMTASLVLYIDAAPAFRKAKLSLYFVLARILELPQSEILSDYNTIVVAIYASSTEKPDRDFFLNPIIDKLNSLKSWSTNIKGERVEFNLWVHSVLADLPAKAFISNCKQYNGQFGCSKCLHPGQPLDEAHPLVRLWRVLPNVEVPLRTTVNMAAHTHTFLQMHNPTKDSYFGIKGSTPLTRLISLPTQLPLDPMHGVDEGIFKRQLEILLKSAGEPYSITKQQLRELNHYISSTQITHEQHRRPKAISSDLKGLKAAQNRLLLEHLLPVVLLGILKEPYYSHFMSLCISIKLLSLPLIQGQNIENAKNLIQFYQNNFENYYGKENCTYNFHALTHLPDQVIIMGPLQNISGYAFESTIGVVKRHSHGSRNVAEQTVRHVAIHKNLRKYHNDKMNANQDSLLNKMSTSFRRSRKKNLEHIGSCYLIGPLKLQTLGNDLKNIMQHSSILTNYAEEILDLQELSVAFRIIKNHEVVHSLGYNKKGDSCSFMVNWIHNGVHQMYGAINFFFKFNEFLLAYVTEFKVQYYHKMTETIDTVGHFIAVENLDHGKTVINCNDILGRVIFIPCKQQNNIIGYLSKVLPLLHD